NEFRQVMEIRLVTAEQRVFEGNGHAAIAVLDIEYHRVAADFTPVADDPNAMIAGRHQPRKVDRPHFKITLCWHRLLHDRRGQQPWNNHRLASLQKRATEIAVSGSNRFSQLAGS